MRKICALGLLLFPLALLCIIMLCGCTEKEEQKTEEYRGIETIEIVEKSLTGDAAVIRDKETNVLYLIIGYRYKTASITPLYNADGSLKTYDGK